MTIEAWLALIGMGGTTIAAVAGLGWWLRDSLQNVADASRATLDTHEANDQRRHEENLERFSQISVELAKFGAQGLRRIAGR